MSYTSKRECLWTKFNFAEQCSGFSKFVKVDLFSNLCPFHLHMDFTPQIRELKCSVINRGGETELYRSTQRNIGKRNETPSKTSSFFHKNITCRASWCVTHQLGISLLDKYSGNLLVLL
jgi:hypothetical protein